jgi:c-di-GMP-binding flagellar brake protein YcgR
MSMEKGWLEKQRQFERVQDILKISFSPIEGTAEQIMATDDYKDTTVEKLANTKSGNSYINAMTDDISKGGMSILTNKPLALKQLVVIDLFLPKISKPIKLLAEVRNVDSAIKGAASYKAGVRILSMSKSDLKRIENHILSLKFEK